MEDHIYQAMATFRGEEEEEEEVDDDDDDLVKELLDNMSPFLMVPRANSSLLQEEQQQQPPFQSSVAGKSKLVPPAVYSGPTLGDIESALSSSFGRRRTNNINAVVDDQHQPTSPMSLVQLEKRNIFGRKENRYTLKVKSFAGGAADDGYKWRKYGQKSIKNRANPRSYFRCTNPRCNAKKQVERSPEDPDVYIITYEGLHLHYAYTSPFLHRTPEHPRNIRPTTTEGSRVRPSSIVFQQQFQLGVSESLSTPNASHSSNKANTSQCSPEEEDDLWATSQEFSDVERESNPRGVLEDILPSLLKSPICSQTTSIDIMDPPSLQAPSPLSPSSCLSWSPMHSYLEVGLLSNTDL